MNINKFTVKLQEAIQEAIGYATEAAHQQIEPEHILLALLRQEDSIVAAVLDNLGVQTFRIIKAIEEDLSRKPSVNGSHTAPYPSNRTNKLLYNASKEAKGLKDEFVSGEHILLALLSDDESVLIKEFRQLNINKETVLSALSRIRGSHRITDENPEEKFNALEKYGQDITDLAAKMELDPVIGRDKEIRRLMQVLSRAPKIIRY